jgi:PAS domain S-box-containing protein
MALKIERSIRITIGISLALVLLQSALSFIIIDNFRSGIRGNLDKQQFALVSTLAREIDGKIQGHLHYASEIARRVPADLMADSSRARAFLKGAGEAGTVFDHGLFLLTPRGRLVAEFPFVSKEREGRDFSWRGQVREVIAKRLPVVSDPYLSSINGEPCVMFTVPLLNSDGSLRGILGGALSLLNDNFLSDVAQARIGTTGYLYLFGRDRTMIVHPDRSRILKKDVAPGSNLMFDRAIAGFEGSGEAVNSRGVGSVASFRSLKKAPWILAADFPVKEAYAPLRGAVRNLLLALACTILSSCVALHLVAGRLKREVAGRAEAEGYASLLLDSVGEGILGVTELGNISFVNKGALELLGYHSAEELLGREAREVLHHSNADCIHCLKEKCLMYPVFAPGTPLHSEGEALWRKDGSSFVADYSCNSVWSEGRLQGAVITFRDISERREILDRLRLQGAALEVADNSMLIVDDANKIIWVNRSFTRLTGYAPEEAMGRTPLELLPGRFDEPLFKKLLETLGSKKPWHGELVTRRKDGTLYDEDVTITPVLDEQGELTHCIGIMQDVTERKRSEEALLKSKCALELANHHLVQAMDLSTELAERAERANAAKSNFLANMSHEIRTPMNAIIGISHLLRDTKLSPQQSDFLQTLSISADLLMGIINDIMDFSRIEAGKLEISRIEFAPGETVAELLAVFAVRAEQKGLELRNEMDRAIPDFLLGDQLRLTQVLNNL